MEVPGGIRSADGRILRVRVDEVTRLICLDQEAPDGQLISTRVLDADEAGRIVRALAEAVDMAERYGAATVDISAVIDRE